VLQVFFSILIIIVDIYILFVELFTVTLRFIFVVYMSFLFLYQPISVNWDNNDVIFCDVKNACAFSHKNVDPF